ncbi:NDR1/HIN1-like protein 13 [Miscanthus floridulus]|uniref:NDR1/HIN1-like protein 13 n=1 Tax=Miscanthus floridulus TaxID=154761 RepID=UPI003457C855
MAERALPPAVPASPEPASSSAVSTAFGSPLEPVAATAAAATPTHDTYVVQVQKDQIYRVPPPENAYLAERYRNERGGGGNKKRGTSSGQGSAACSP